MPLTAADANRYRLEIRPVHRALAQPLQTGGGRSIAVRPSVLLKATPLNDTKPVGYGEAAPLPWFGTESAEAATNALSAIGTEIRTAQQHDTTGSPWHDSLEALLPKKLAQVLHAAPCARWALECALRQAGALPPLAATDTALTLLTPTLPVAALLPAASATIPQQLLDAGATTFKIKIGVRPFADETAAVHSLLEALRTRQQQQGNAAPSAAAKQFTTASGEANAAPCVPTPATQFKLRLDANGSLNAASLQQWLRLLEPVAELVDFIEQPFAAGYERQTADAFTNSSVSFAFDESLTSLPRLIQMAAAFPQAVLVIKPSLLGSAEGFLRWRSTLGLAARVVYSSALETGIGIAHALALAAVDPLPVQPVGFGTGSLFQADGLGPLPQAQWGLQPAGNSPAAYALRTHMEAVWKLA